MATVLLIEDNPGDARLLELVLEEHGAGRFSLEKAETLSAGLERLSRGGIDVVLVDLTLPDSDGIDTFHAIKTRFASMPVVVMSGLDAESLALLAVQEGAQDYLVKGPGTSGELVLRALSYAIERERAETALRATRDSAEAANRTKARFVAVVSHEIRSPASTILGFAEILAGTSLDPEQRDLLDRIARAASTLVELSGDLLEASTEEAQPRPLQRVELDLAAIVRDVTDAFSVPARQKGLPLESSIADDVPRHVVGDPVRLRQVLVNLIGNALKFTERGHIRLLVSKPSRQTVRFVVADTGPGIPPERQEAIFEPFAQADETIRARFGGAGLGLSVARSLVERMGGSLGVESEEGRGSTFFFTIELASVNVGNAQPPIGEDFRGLRVLVVEPDEEVRRSLSHRLVARGADVEEADGGAAALAALRRGPAIRFHAILLACRMRGFGGFEVVHHLRDVPEVVSRMVMLLPPDFRRGDPERARSLGLAATVAYPVGDDDLTNAIASARGIPAGSGANVKRADPTRPTQPSRILLVDDSDEIRMIVERFLEGVPVTLDMAAGGQQGVERFRGAVYDLVLMDLEMPGLDGRAATRAIRRWELENGRDPTPVVALSAHGHGSEIRSAFEAGCTAHLEKPFTRRQLLHAIQRYLPEPGLSEAEPPQNRERTANGH